VRLQAAVRRLGHIVASAALRLVPAPLQLSVLSAIRAIERTLDQELGLGR